MIDALVLAVVIAALAGGALLITGLRGTTAPPGPPSPWQLRLRGWWRGGGGLTPRERQRRQILFGAALATVVVCWLLTRIPGAGLAAGSLVLGAPWIWNLPGRERRSIARLDAISKWILGLRDNLTTGMGLTAAVVANAANAPDAIAAEVRQLAERLQAAQESPEIALRRFADLLADPASDQVVAILILHLADHGEGLKDVLGALAAANAKVVAARQDTLANRGAAFTSIRFMLVYVSLAIAIIVINHDTSRSFHNPLGQLIFIVFLAAMAGVFVWVRAMCKPQRVQRLLTVLPPAGGQQR